MSSPGEHPLKTWRIAKGLTVPDAAVQVPVTRQTWYSWERNGSRPPEQLMARLVEMTEGAVQPNDFYPAAAARLQRAA
jgi:DNA-binding XRE family transcriptional regulator